MGYTEKRLKRRYKKKTKFYDNRHTKKSNTTATTSTPINQVNPTTSSSTDLPGASLSSKKLKLIANNGASNTNEMA